MRLGIEKRRRGGAAAAALAFALAACASASAFNGTIYRRDDVAFRVPPRPAEWRQIQLSTASLAFRDDPHEASVLVNGRCHVEDAPLLALTNQLIMGTTAREPISQETLPFDGREALHTKMRAKLDGVPMMYDIYVLKKDGCVFDFAYVAPPEHAEAGFEGFERFVLGFHTLAGSG